MITDVWRPQQTPVGSTFQSTLSQPFGYLQHLIDNSEGASWASVENRMSAPITVGVTDRNNPQLGVGFTVPGLRERTVPIDPELAVILSTGGGRPWAIVPTPGGLQGLDYSARSVVTKLTQQGSQETRELYPLGSCLQIVRQVTALGAGGSVVHGILQNLTGIGGFTAILRDGAAVAATFGSPTIGPSQDACIVAVTVGITALGTTATTDGLSLAYGWGTAGFDTFSGVFGGSAAGASNVIAPVTIPLPGADYVVWQNNNAGAGPTVSFIVTYYIGLPAILPQ